MEDYKVRLFENGSVTGMVSYTDNLDHWDGRNRTCGETGRHLGIGKLKDGRYFVCYGTQWQGERDYAEIIDEASAKELCLKHNSEVYAEIFGEEPPVLD